MEVSDPIEQLQDDNNLTKYKTAGKIVAKVLDDLIYLVKPGANIKDLCNTGDSKILEEVNKVYNSIKHKGIAFPSCVSVNNIAGYCCGSASQVQHSDLVKIELGVHIDGFPALVAYTVLVNETGELLQDSKKYSVVQAVNEASKEILQNMTVKHSNFDISDILEKCALKYNCSLPQVDTINDLTHAPGILSYEISRNVVDGLNDDDDKFIHRFILAKNSEKYDMSMRETQFEELEVYAIDIVMCSGDGKLCQADGETNIYKRVVDRRENLKLKASRETLGLFKTRFPINVMSVANSKTKFGLKECIEKNLVEPYTVLRAKEGEVIARAKFTVVVKDKPVLIVGKSLESQLSKLKCPSTDPSNSLLTTPLTDPSNSLSTTPPTDSSNSLLTTPLTDPSNNPAEASVTSRA